jgi:hypothetical protein
MKTGPQTLIFELVEGKKYFSARFLKTQLAERNLSYSPTTVNQYLYNLRAGGRLYDAGRGWYSLLPHKALLDCSHVEAIASAVESNYPLLTFSCWSTEQIQAFSHHLQTNFTRFLYADRDALLSLRDFLSANGYNVHQNPGIKWSDEYRRYPGIPVILRPSITEEPVHGNFATVEKLLVDLYLEKDRAVLMDESEYHRVFSNLVYSYRINMAKLLRYAHRRKVKHRFIRGILARDTHLVAQ